MANQPAELLTTDDEFVRELMRHLTPEQRLEGLDIAQRLAGLDAEQRLAGLDEAHAVLALPIAVLRGLTPEYIASLPSDVRRKVKSKLRKGLSSLC